MAGDYTRLTQEQKGYALAMSQAQGWRGRERVSFWWPLLGWVAYTALKRLAEERSKVACRQCGGEGRLRYNAGPWGVDTECDRCHGEGKHLP